MVYVALTFWLLVTVLTAWGVHQLWSGMIKARMLNMLLLPGTLAAQLGHVLGLLVTGATVTNTSLLKDDESAAPETTPNPKPRIPVIGPVIIGLLPLVACVTGIYFAAQALGGPMLRALGGSGAVRAQLPLSFTGFWQLLRDQISLVEAFTAALRSANYDNWQTWGFLYLLICLSIRLAPFPGMLRGSLGAIVVLGLGAAAASRLFDVGDPRVQAGWSVLNLPVATLLFLLVISLLVRGSVGLFQLLRAESN